MARAATATRARRHGPEGVPRGVAGASDGGGSVPPVPRGGDARHPPPPRRPGRTRCPSCSRGRPAWSSAWPTSAASPGRSRSGSTRPAPRLALTYQNERTEGEVRKLAESLANCDAVLPLDVQDDAQLASSVAEAGAALGGLDTLVHAVAFAQAEDLGGRFVDTGREGFHLAMDVSAYSLAALAREAEPHMRARGGGSIMTLSYIAADRAVPGLQRDGRGQGRPRGDRALPGVGPRRRRHPRQRDLRRARADARRPRHPRLRHDGRPGRRARPAAARHHRRTRWPTPPSSWRPRCRPASPARRSSWTPASTRWGSDRAPPAPRAHRRRGRHARRRAPAGPPVRGRRGPGRRQPDRPRRRPHRHDRARGAGPHRARRRRAREPRRGGRHRRRHAARRGHRGRRPPDRRDPRDAHQGRRAPRRRALPPGRPGRSSSASTAPCAAASATSTA